MRVLHLPTNIASQISMMVRAQRVIGLDARGLVINNQIIQTGTGVRNFNTVAPRGHPVCARIRSFQRWAAVASAIAWADVVHWHFDARTLRADLDLKLAATLGKARIVQFWGSDIRIPEIAVRDNPYLARLLTEHPDDYLISYHRSRGVQERFARYGFACVVPGPELRAYVQPDLFPSPYRAEAVLDLAEFTPRYPDPAQRKPVVVHTPSNLSVKGTACVLAAVEQLKAEHNFEFRLIHNVPRAEALALTQDCDIMLDQFVIGSFGTAALEAMALGKPAVCYLTPSVAAALPTDAPYINANQENLAQVLGELLADGERRHEIGRRSRAYVEQHHDATVIARQLLAIYHELLAKKQGMRRGNR